MRGVPPFVSASRDVLYRKILSAEPEFDDDYDKDAIDMIAQILTKNPNQRPKLKDIKQHPFFSCLDWSQV